MINLIKTFGLVVKPKITKGKGMWNPLNNQVFDSKIYCIRDKDVNCFIIKTEAGYFAIDSGYMDSKNVRTGLKLFDINPMFVTDVFLTHLDIDHAGGMNKNSDIVFPNAKIHLSYEEEKYLTGEYSRKTVAGHKCKLPIQLSEYTCFYDNDEIQVSGNIIKTVLAPGHSMGHTAFILNKKYLFSGDCIIANKNGGYLFYDFWNQNFDLNKESANKLKNISANNVEYVITSHSGILKPNNAFKYIDKSPAWKQKGFVFCDDADYDPYSITE